MIAYITTSACLLDTNVPKSELIALLMELFGHLEYIFLLIYIYISKTC